ncbi:hypothetical protein HYPSUDRAFT_1038100 [Hypholoma sublateritium FD-334 SS-4]|uniref:Uncharacterized protein n=1 Tax=Hypholoma sublateritium (strain FD-334 SS-4) TaxID=945553 RepID=A0A0D2LH54_HYPSF|nr:hypothetical protein HYPSUDRAFT_1038100 [Hypholoma sublateritium FD-334 SS-4]
MLILIIHLPLNYTITIITLHTTEYPAEFSAKNGHACFEKILVLRGAAETAVPPQLTEMSLWVNFKGNQNVSASVLGYNTRSEIVADRFSVSTQYGRSEGAWRLDPHYILQWCSIASNLSIKLYSETPADIIFAEFSGLLIVGQFFDLRKIVASRLLPWVIGSPSLMSFE